MCGRYALGAAHIDFLEGLENQYPRFFAGRAGGDGDGRVRGGGGGGPLRLRGGGEGGEHDQPTASSSSQATESTNPCKAVAAGKGIKWEREQDFWPSYNIAPRQRAPVVRRDPATGDAMIETMQWGLIPHWTKFPPSGPLNTINARSEALIDPSSGGMWHALKAHKRCVIPAQGYYEWHKKGGGNSKVANFVRLPLTDKSPNPRAPPLLFFAGLWDTVTYASPVASKFVPKEGDDREPYPTGNPVPLSTFTIVTTTPARDIAWLHDRMPVVLTSEEDVAAWLDLGSSPKGWVEGKGGTGDLLSSFGGLTAYPVVPEVGKIGHSEQNYILPVAERNDGIKSFFQKQAASPAKPKNSVKVEAQLKAENKKPKVEDKQLKVEATSVKAGPDTKPAPSANEAKPSAATAVVVIDDDDDADTKPTPAATSSKRKRSDEPAPRGGHKTKVERKEVKEKPKGQPSIASFFKSPKK